MIDTKWIRQIIIIIVIILVISTSSISSIGGHISTGGGMDLMIDVWFIENRSGEESNK